MIIRVGIENNNDDRTIAWALEHPGCFAYGVNSVEAAQNMEAAARLYIQWLRLNGGTWLPDEPVQVRPEESFDVYFLHTQFEPPGTPARGIMIESFFIHDKKPLTATDVERALQLLDWSRKDLLDTVKGLSTEKLNQTYGGERWSISGILRHIATAEWWYQERIGFPFPRNENDLPQDSLECLELVRANFTSVLPKLEGVYEALALDGEVWSPRKALRRALWHERDHTEHIRKLL